MATGGRVAGAGPKGGWGVRAASVHVDYLSASVQEVRSMQLYADVNARECQDVVVAEVDAIACGGGKQRIQLVDREAGAVVGMRDIDKVMLELAEIGDRDVAAVEYEGVGAAEPGQGVV